MGALVREVARMARRRRRIRGAGVEAEGNRGVGVVCRSEALGTLRSGGGRRVCRICPGSKRQQSFGVGRRAGG
jgi:hypothetical protein